MKHIGVIIGSTRPKRIGPVIAKWLIESITVKHNMTFEVIDLKEWDLPLFNEPNMPATGIYVHEKTQNWSKKISSKDGFIFVTPQYNWGYPAALKNAIDYLSKEWKGKPAIIASYAYRGGGKAAEQLRQVGQGISLKMAPTMPAISLVKDMFTESGDIKETYEGFAQYTDVIDKAITEMNEELNLLDDIIPPL